MGDDYIKYETKEQIFVTDGKYVWSYSSATNQTIIDIYKSDEDEALPKEVIFNFDKKYNSKFVGMENIGGIDCYVLQGTPKNENLEIKSIKLWIDSKKWVAKKIEYINLNDNVIIYNIENVKFNNELKNTFFKFEPPKNSEIIDLRIQQY
jgi:outer membrane lipoprotein-sorting protein